MFSSWFIPGCLSCHWSSLVQFDSLSDRPAFLSVLSCARLVSFLCCASSCFQVVFRFWVLWSLCLPSSYFCPIRIRFLQWSSFSFYFIFLVAQAACCQMFLKAHKTDKIVFHSVVVKNEASWFFIHLICVLEAFTLTATVGVTTKPTTHNNSSERCHEQKFLSPPSSSPSDSSSSSVFIRSSICRILFVLLISTNCDWWSYLETTRNTNL